MLLTDDEKRLADGQDGAAVAAAMNLLVRYGEALGAERLCDVRNVAGSMTQPSPVKARLVAEGGWAKAFAVINLEWKKLLFPLLAVTQWIMLPVLLAMSASGIAFRPQPMYLGIAFASYLAIRYAETAQYMIRRPHMHWTAKLVMWLWATPAEMLVKILVIYPAKYSAIFKLRDRGWVTRGNAHAGHTASAVELPDDDTVQIPRIPVAKLLDPDTETTLQIALNGR
jgi:hypothetical protein